MRISSLLEDEEKGELSSYVIKLILEELVVDESPENLERCHRICMKQKNSKYPRMVIFKLSNYQTKVNILKAQGERRSKSMVSPFDSSRICLLS